MIKKVGLLLVIGLAIGMFSEKIMPLNTKGTSPAVKRTWTVKDSKAYARDALYYWADKQYVCLAKLWGKESAWNPRAYNKDKVMGKNAGGIPQLLGLDPNTPATIQIDRGIAYIKYRWVTPCRAWSHHKRKGWY